MSLKFKARLEREVVSVIVREATGETEEIR